MAMAMPSDELVIANPESAGRVFEAGEDVRAFLMERGGDGTAIDPPWLLWLHSPRAANWSDKCPHGCDVVYYLTTESTEQVISLARSKGQAIPPMGRPIICPCMGRFIE